MTDTSSLLGHIKLIMDAQLPGEEKKGEKLIVDTFERTPIEKLEGAKLARYRKTVRPTWDEYFMNLMDVVSKRATCDRGKSGCVITKDNHILVTGYVGSPKGLPHCDEDGHYMKKMLHDDGKISEHCVRTIHAEQNAICQAAKLGIPLKGSTLYCRMTPCRVCAMLIINSGITRVLCERMYRSGADSLDMFTRANVKISFIHDEIQKYKGEDDVPSS